MVNRSSSGRFARKPDTEVDRKTSTRAKRARRELDDADPNKQAAGNAQAGKKNLNEPNEPATVTSPPKKKVLRSHGPAAPPAELPSKLTSRPVLGRLPTRPKKVAIQPVKKEAQETPLSPPPLSATTTKQIRKRAALAPGRPVIPRKRNGEDLQKRKKVKIQHHDDEPPLLKPPKPTEHLEKRTLRSAAGTSRTRSGLALFFPEYEDHVFGPEKEPGYIDVQSTLFLTKDTRNPDEKRTTPTSPAKPSPQKSPKSPKSPRLGRLSSKNSKKPTKSSDFETVDLEAYKEEARKFDEDPLSDEVFIIAHRRGERKEKQMRNIEKEYARHERSELERLLEELQGPDWLRTMGISGVTETEKKAYEPKREHYVRGVKGLLQKFVTWDQQEKALKIQRDQKLAALREEAEAEEEYEDEDVEDYDDEESLLEIPDSEADPPP